MKKLLLIITILLTPTICFANIAWYICPYKRLTGATKPIRYCAMDDFTSTINADSGRWREVEVLGNSCIVKVKASASTITTLNSNFTRIPLQLLDDSLSSLTVGQKNAINAQMLTLGYTQTEINNKFGGNLNAFTLRDILKFIATRRIKPRYDVGTDAIVLDSTVITLPLTIIDDLDNAVSP